MRKRKRKRKREKEKEKHLPLSPCSYPISSTTKRKPSSSKYYNSPFKDHRNPTHKTIQEKEQPFPQPAERKDTTDITLRMAARHGAGRGKDFTVGVSGVFRVQLHSYLLSFA